MSAAEAEQSLKNLTPARSGTSGERRHEAERRGGGGRGRRPCVTRGLASIGGALGRARPLEADRRRPDRRRALSGGIRRGRRLAQARPVTDRGAGAAVGAVPVASDMKPGHLAERRRGPAPAPCPPPRPRAIRARLAGAQRARRALPARLALEEARPARRAPPRSARSAPTTRIAAVPRAEPRGAQRVRVEGRVEPVGPERGGAEGPPGKTRPMPSGAPPPSPSMIAPQRRAEAAPRRRRAGARRPRARRTSSRARRKPSGSATAAGTRASVSTFWTSVGRP